MKFKKIFSKTLVCAIALNLLAPVAYTPIPVYASDFSDTSSHWAEKYIKSAVSKGIVKGYSDGTFKPDKAVTRAEFAAMVNKALGNTGTASISFNDIPSSKWFYSDISKAVAATYVAGYDDSSFKPNNPITREEAAAIISRIVPSSDSSGDLKAFSDYGSISNWALSAIQKCNNKGYIGAYDDGKIHPKDQLTRAQTAKIISDITDKETIVSSAPSIKTSGTTLSGKIYSNGIILHKELEEGNVAIDNCIIMGELSIQGGGSNSVVINNSRVVDCNIAKMNSSVRVVTKGNTSILTTDVSNKAKLETFNLTGEDTGIGFCKVNANGSSELLLAGNFPNIEVIGSNANVKLESGNVTTLDVGSSARNSKITVENNATISTSNVNSSVSFLGNGTVQKMNANADGITYEKKPSNLSIGSGVTTKPIEIRGGITFDPVDGGKNVAKNKKITITFSQSMTKYNGKEIVNSDLKNLIKFTKESKSGTDVPFSASIDSAKKMITITPDKELTSGVKYCITMGPDIFKNERGEGNAAQSICFTVQSGTVTPTINFNPINGAAGVSATANIYATFSERIFNSSGSVPNGAYISGAITIRDNTQGINIPYSTFFSDSSSPVISIDPTKDLTGGHNYTLTVAGNFFKNSDGNYVASSTTSFTVLGNVNVIDVSVINTAINRAYGAKTGVVQSENGKEVPDNVYWVSSSQMNALNNAIVKATNALSTVGTPAAASSAAESLNSVSIAFEQSKKLGLKKKEDTPVVDNKVDTPVVDNKVNTPVVDNKVDIPVIDTTEIDHAINGANYFKRGVVISEDGTDVEPSKQWVTPALMSALNDAITKAKNAKATVRTAEEVNEVVLELNWAAVKHFDLEKKYGTKGSINNGKLASAINNAKSLKNITEMSTDGKDIPLDKYWVTNKEMSDFGNDIYKAEKVLRSSTSQAEIDNAESTINAAAESFTKIRQLGTKEN
ncbi:MAG: S-layer homology domain-containing protein [Aminipila sp.]